MERQQEEKRILGQQEQQQLDQQQEKERKLRQKEQQLFEQLQEKDRRLRYKDQQQLESQRERERKLMKKTTGFTGAIKTNQETKKVTFVAETIPDPITVRISQKSWAI